MENDLFESDELVDSTIDTLELQLYGRSIRMILCHTEDELTDNSGISFTDSNYAFISAGKSLANRLNTFYHELGHFGVDIPGGLIPSNEEGFCDVYSAINTALILENGPDIHAKIFAYLSQKRNKRKNS